MRCGRGGVECNISGRVWRSRDMAKEGGLKRDRVEEEEKAGVNRIDAGEDLLGMGRLATGRGCGRDFSGRYKGGGRDCGGGGMLRDQSSHLVLLSL